jgi:starch synthase
MGHAVALSPFQHVDALLTRTQRYFKNPSTHNAPKKILFVTSEYSELVKIGGLGDVSSALPKALASHYDIRILIPGYPQVINSGNPMKVVGRLHAYADLPECSIAHMTLADGQILYVLLCPELYEREGNPYVDNHGKDWADNPVRFARLGLAAAEIAANNAQLHWQPDLVHANDWPAALAPAYMKWRGVYTPSIFTIHNLAYQGLCTADHRSSLGLSPEAMHIDSMEFYGQLSFLKAGINYADHITTVSKTYAWEITTPTFGCGLDGLLKQKFDRGQLSGIANGIDETWDPVSDPHLVENFNPCFRRAKEANARYVEQMFGLRAGNGPLFSVVSRLVQQKGIDLTIHIAESIVNAGGRLAIIGCGEPELEAELVRLAQRHSQNIGVHIGFNETDARRMFAGSDFLLMPSRFEPCGLSQMYAQRFGSLPIARHTGGLADTIDDGVTGFLFRDPEPAHYWQSVQRAFNVVRKPNLFNAMRCRAMASPLSWKQSVKPYDQLYRQLLVPSLVSQLIPDQGGVCA